jgi:hypothetical protein
MTSITMSSNAGSPELKRRSPDALLAVKRLLSPLQQAKRIADVFDAVDDFSLPANEAPDPVRLALLPSEDDVHQALRFLDKALNERCEARTARGLIVGYLDCLGRAAGPNAQAQLDGLVHVLVEDAVFDEQIDREVIISPVCLALALHRLLKSTKFIPTPSELYEHCVTAVGSIEKLYERIRDHWESVVGGFIIELEYRSERQRVIASGKVFDDAAETAFLLR